MRYIQLLVFILCSTVGLAQENSLKYQNLFVNVQGGYGFLPPHHQSIKYFVEDHVPEFKLEAGFQTYGHKNWHHHHEFPDIGFGYTFSGLGNKQVYGNAHALYSFIQTRMNKVPRRVQVKQKFGFGLSYVTEIYDLRENPYNLAISSNLNVYLSYMLGAEVKLNDQLAAFTGINFTHFSNGKLKEPNKGLNTVTASAGMSYRFRQKEPQPLADEPEDFDVKRWSVFYSVGWKQVSRRLEGYFFASSLSLDYAFFARHHNKMGIGLDFFYDSSVDEHRIFDYEEMTDRKEFFRSAFHFSYEFVVGRTSFVIQPGFYFFNPYNKYGYGVNRLGIRYRLTPSLVTNVAIKAHLFAKADFIEWGLGYAF